MPKARRVFRWLLLAGLLALVVAPASAQTVRVVEPDATIRIGPDSSSSVLMTVKLGTVLETTGREGDWFIVVLPADSQGLRRMGYIAANLVEVQPETTSKPPAVPAAQTPRPLSQAASAPVAAAGPASVSADWQLRWNRASEKRRSGKTLEWTGIVASAMGLGMELAAFGRMDEGYHNSLLWTGLAVGSVGCVVGIIGSSRVRDANQELTSLEVERTRGQSAGVALLLPRRGIGIGYQVAW